MDRILSFATLLATLTLSASLRHFLEADVDAAPGTVLNRSAASGGKIVHLRAGQHVRVAFCLRATSHVRVRDVRYSNDGDEDRLQLWLAGRQVGEITTHDATGNGRLWNELQSSGSVGGDLLLPRSRHVLEIRAAAADGYGVEVDGVWLEVDDPELTPAQLECHVFCLEHDRQLPVLPSPEASASARAVQASAATSCAEEDNVQVLFFHDRLTKYRITATHPLYNTGDNSRQPNFTACRMTDDRLWKFSGLALTEHSLMALDNDAVLVTSPSSKFNVTIRVRFALSSNDEAGFTPIDSGNILTLALSSPLTELQARVSWSGRSSGWSTPSSATFTPSTRLHTWIVPDFTWADHDDNEILIEVTGRGQSVRSAVIDKLELRRRRLRSDQSLTLYKDDDVVVEAVTMDMWWRGESMALTLEGNTTQIPANYVRLYRRLPWGTGAFSQVLVLYQDGNLRLLPPTPPGRDWIPFGSSVLLGQASSSARPFAALARVHLNALASTLDLVYKDGGLTRLHVGVGLDRTEVEVEVRHLAGNQALLPFASLRSMWVADGLADVDRLVVDRGQPLAVLDNWTTLHGHQFLFYRSCISGHNALSPDIRLDVF